MSIRRTHLRARSGPAPGLASLVCLGLGLILPAACNEPTVRTAVVPVPLTYKGGLLFGYGQILPTQDRRCVDDPDEPNPLDAPPSSSLMVLDTAMPLTAFAGRKDAPAQVYPDGQVSLFTPGTASAPGVPRLLRCDARVLRSDQLFGDFRLVWGAAQSEPLGGVLGGDLFLDYALTLRFAPDPRRPDEALLEIARGDITPTCRVDDAVLPFRLLGGELQVKVSDNVITYPASRITVPVCIEPLADPLAAGAAQTEVATCIDPQRLDRRIQELTAQLQKEQAKPPPEQSEQLIGQLGDWLAALSSAREPMCDATKLDLRELGDAVEAGDLRRPPYKPSGVDMRFLVSTAVPGLLLSETACARLGRTDCMKCLESGLGLPVRLPGLNDGQTQDLACRIELGDEAHAALALVARGRFMGPCAELARSRRQRYALPQAATTATTPPPCLAEACLQNLERDPALADRRCGYTGLDSDLACDDHRAQASAFVELGGPLPDPTGMGMIPPDKLEALVVRDSARVLQAANADLRNVSAQVDGVLGVSVLSRLVTTIDYPQSRLALSCRCGNEHACRAYRSVTHHDADSCSPDESLVIPRGFSRTLCRF